MPILKNSRHEQFCHLVATGSPAYQAYIDAGYSEQGARASSSKLLTKPNIVSRIEEMKANIEKTVEVKVGISKSYVIAKLQENLERSLQNVPVLDREGNETGEYRYEGNVANKALELIGKELGMFQGRDKEGNPGDPNAPKTVVMVVERPIIPENPPCDDEAADEIEPPEPI